MPSAGEVALRAMQQCGALKSGHFQLSSGLHSDRYCQCATLFEHPKLGAQLAELMAKEWGGETIDTVLSPALGGVLWGYDLARALGARSLFAERNGATGEKFVLRRGFAMSPGERVLLAEDVVTTGGSIMELVPLVEEAGARVVGFAAVADRSGGRFAPGAPFRALAKLDFETYQPAGCPMCRAGTPIDKPGSRKTEAKGMTL